MYKYFNTVMVAFLLCLALTGCGSGGGRFKIDPSLQKDLVTFNGCQYVPLTRACTVYGIQCDWDPYTRRAVLTKGPYIVIAMAGSDRILVNGAEKRLSRPVKFDAGTVYEPVTLVGRNLILMIEGASSGGSAAPAASRPVPAAVPAAAPALPVPPVRHAAVMTVVLDPGHGGKDVGAIGRTHGLLEKDNTLAIARRVSDILTRSGMRVIMTRDTDEFIPLPQRAEIANKAGADLFVSIHINSARTRFLRGFECYYLSDAADDNARSLEALENSSLKLSDEADVEHSTGLDRTLWDLTFTENRIESAELAERICGSVRGSLPINDRGVKTAKFYVLKHTSMPSVLVEVCYLSNPHDETMLKGKTFQDAVARAVAGGILHYKNEFEKTEGFTKI